MFKVVIGLEDVGKYDKFTEAFKMLFEKIGEMRSTGISVKALETTCFLVYEFDGEKQQMDFHQAWGFAYNTGLLADNGKLGELKPLVKEPPKEVIVAGFAKATIENLNAQLVNKIFDYMVGPI